MNNIRAKPLGAFLIKKNKEIIHEANINGYI